MVRLFCDALVAPGARRSNLSKWPRHHGGSISMVRLGSSKGRERMTHSQIEAQFKRLESREEHVRGPLHGQHLAQEVPWLADGTKHGGKRRCGRCFCPCRPRPARCVCPLWVTATGAPPSPG